MAHEGWTSPWLVDCSPGKAFWLTRMTIHSERVKFFGPSVCLHGLSSTLARPTNMTTFTGGLIWEAVYWADLICLSQGCPWVVNSYFTAMADDGWRCEEGGGGGMGIGLELAHAWLFPGLKTKHMHTNTKYPQRAPSPDLQWDLHHVVVG